MSVFMFKPSTAVTTASVKVAQLVMENKYTTKNQVPTITKGEKLMKQQILTEYRRHLVVLQKVVLLWE